MLDTQTRTEFDGQSYGLVFSDEFNTMGRTLSPSVVSSPSHPVLTLLLTGDDTFWETFSIWYGSTND